MGLHRHRPVAAGGAHQRHQLGRRGGARQGQIAQMPVVNQRCQVAQQVANVLVAHHAEDRVGGREVAHLVQAVGQRGHRLRVVGHVQHQRGLARHDLEAAGQFHHCQAIAHRLGIDRQPVTQGLEDCQHAGRIQQLVGAAQRRVGQAGQTLAAAAPGPLLLVTLDIEVAAQLPQLSPQRVGAGLQRGRWLGVTDHHRPARAHDAGLLDGDGLAVGAQELGVVQRDAGDQRAVGIDGVHSVQPAAHAHLQDHQVQRRLGQGPQDGQGGELEPGQRGAAARRLHRREVRQQAVGAGHLAIDAAAFLKVNQVRLDVQAHPVAALQRDGFEHRAGRALAIGAGHADHRHRKAQAQAVAHGGHTVQRHVDGLGVQLLAVGEPAGQGGGQGHGAIRSAAWK